MNTIIYTSKNKPNKMTLQTYLETTENNITIEPNLLREINMGIYCHSESRVKMMEVTDPIFAIPRCADKFYAFTDVADILVAFENDFSIDNLENYTLTAFSLLNDVSTSGIGLYIQFNNNMLLIKDSSNNNIKNIENNKKRRQTNLLPPFFVCF